MSWLNHFLQAHGSGSEQAIDQLQQQLMAKSWAEADNEKLKL